MTTTSIEPFTDQDLTLVTATFGALFEFTSVRGGYSFDTVPESAD